MTKRTWVIEDHICCHCSGGRVLRCVTGNGVTPGGNPVYRCADCGASAYSVDDICWCGFHFKNQHIHGYRCLPFSILEEKPYLREAFFSCGCDPSRGEVGIVTVDSFRRLNDEERKDSR